MSTEKSDVRATAGGWAAVEKLRTVPLLLALVPVAGGILTGSFLTQIPLYVWITCAIVCGAACGVALVAGGRIATLYIGLTLLFFGAAVARFHTPQSTLPQGERMRIQVLLTDVPSWRGGRWMNASGRVVPSGERLLVAIDTMWNFDVGERISFTGYVNPIDSVSASYSRLMRARGYVGRTYITPFSRPTVAIESRLGSGSGSGLGSRLGFGARLSLGARFKKLQAAASARIRGLRGVRGGSENAFDVSTSDAPTSAATDSFAVAATDAFAVAAAMTTGDRSALSPSLRRAYSSTGAAHLLAVSGLHVGIIFLIINVLLYLLPFAPGGFFVKNALAVVAIWAFAALSGLSPSATRAAIMFTGVQLALAFSRGHSSANILCGTALVMLAVRPGLLFDISFQLSFVAVGAIIAWFAPLYQLVASRWRALNALWSVLIVGFVASVAALPLVSNTFGVFSLAGIVLNPIVIVTAHLIVSFSALWLIFPLSFLAPTFRWLVGVPAWLQNTVIESVAGVSGAYVEWTMPLWMVFASYGTMAALTAWFYLRESLRPRHT